MKYTELTKTVLSNVKSNQELYRKELLKGLYFMQENNESTESFLDWLEEDSEQIFLE